MKLDGGCVMCTHVLYNKQMTVKSPDSDLQPDLLGSDPPSATQLDDPWMTHYNLLVPQFPSL